MHGNEILAVCRTLPDNELQERLAYDKHEDKTRHIPDEALLTLFVESRCSGDKQRQGVLSEALSRRILVRAGQFLPRSGLYPKHYSDFETARHELASFFWERLITNNSDLLACQARFGQVFKRRALDFQRRHFSKKRTYQDSLDEMSESPDGEQNDAAERVTGLKEEIRPDDFLQQKRLFEQLRSAMHKVLTTEEFTTLELLYDYDLPVASEDPRVVTVASTLSVDRRTVQNYRNRAFAKLKKELAK